MKFVFRRFCESLEFVLLIDSPIPRFFTSYATL